MVVQACVTDLRLVYTEKHSSLSMVLGDHAGVVLVLYESLNWGELCLQLLVSSLVKFSGFSRNVLE